MVDVLKAVTQAHAPLSQAQTVKVFQYLEDMNKETRRMLSDFKREHELSTSGHGNQKLDLRTLDAAVMTLQQEHVKTNNRLSALRVDVLSNAASVMTLQEQATKATDSLDQLKEGQKVTNTNVHNLREEYLAAKEAIKKIQKEINSLQEAKENVLQAKLDQALLAMRQCLQDVEHNKTLTFKNQDVCHNLSVSLESAQVEIKKLDNAKVDHERRITELNLKGDSMKENLEMTNGVVMRLHSEHEETRMKAIDNMNKCHEIDLSLRRSGTDYDETVMRVQNIKEEVAKLSAGQSTTQGKLSETNQRVGELSNGTVNLQNAMHEMSKNIEIIHNLASNTQDNLKMTNALVLPNLEADGAIGASGSGGVGAAFAFAKSMNSTARQDSEMGSTRMSVKSSKNSPRRRKEAAWFARNIGSVPDRMAWI